jgi:hypothetical protein
VVSAGVVDTAFVKAGKELPTQGVQKPPRGVGDKRFPGEFLAAPAVMVKIPAGLRTSQGRRQPPHYLHSFSLARLCLTSG